MDTAIANNTRQLCRDVILHFLNECSAPVDLRAVAPIYHGFYVMSKGAPRWNNLSSFLARMETDGLVRCTYTRNGLVSTVAVTAYTDQATYPEKL